MVDKTFVDGDSISIQRGVYPFNNSKLNKETFTLLVVYLDGRH